MSNGKRINLFREKKKPRKKVDDKVFDMMTAAADKTDVNLEKTAKLDKSTKSIHTALMAAGMTPGIGNVADLTDATLYALEGELGNAAWSAAAAIPIIGQMVSGKRALKAAKQAGEEMVTIYRGVSHVDKYEMIYKGKFISPKDLFNKPWDAEFFKSMKPGQKEFFIDYWTKKQGRAWGGQPTKIGTWASKDISKAKRYTSKELNSKLLEFEVPKKWLKEHTHKVEKDWIEGGIPREFLKKVTIIK